MKLVALGLFAFVLLAAPPPRHLVLPGFTPAGSPRQTARLFTEQQIRQAGLPESAAAGLYLHREYRTAHNGVTHLVYRQQFQGLDVYKAEWAVNIDRDGNVINAGGFLYEPPMSGVVMPQGAQLARQAAMAAVKAVNPVLAREAELQALPAGKRGEVRFSTSTAVGEVSGTPMWYPVRGRLEPVFVFVATGEDGVSNYETVIDARTLAFLEKDNLTWFQAAPRGLVYTRRSPQPTPNPGEKLSGEPPYVDRELVPFTGDPLASPSGWLTGDATSGNNTVTGVNLLGLTFTMPLMTRAANRDFSFPLQLGPGAPAPTQFPDAASSNLFYWVNRIHDLFYNIGFDEAAGNYQVNNFGRGGVGGDPLVAHAHFGAAPAGPSPNLNNAFFSTRSRDDGSDSMIAMFLGSSSGRWADGAYSTETIFHEYTHGVTSRLIRTITGHQGGAMNEAFSDFWALEFLTPEGAPPDGIYPYGEYLYNTFGVGIRSRPYSTNMEVNPLTYRDLGRAISTPSVHNDGGIWMMSLWEMRANLIRQFGETEGRRRLKLIVLDGMKLSPPQPSMVDVRDAILLADRVNFRGESQSQIWEAFAKRGLGVLAFSANASTLAVTASFERPSNEGQIRFELERPVLGDSVRIFLHDGNNAASSVEVDVTSSSGDVERVVLRRTGSTYVGTVFTTTARAISGNGALSLIYGDQISVYYNDANPAKQITATVSVMGNYSVTGFTPQPFQPGNERPLGLSLPAGSGAIAIVGLPFDFPFYGTKYREVRVSPMGLLQFDTTPAPACADLAGLGELVAIAPLWTWMRTNGATQQNQGVFLSTGPDSVTFRWAGETSPIFTTPPPFGAPPEPLNFAATLYVDGRIEFRYGNGNQNVVNPQVFSGCSSETLAPMVGISRGVRTSVAASGFSLYRVNFNNAATIRYTPAMNHSTLPSVQIASPTAGQAMDRLFVIGGTLTDADDSFPVANVLIDGRYMGRATVSQGRFTFNVNADVLGLEPGVHRLQIRAVNARGGFVDFPETPLEFTIRGEAFSPVQGEVESPRAGETLTGVATISGYAFSPRLRVTAVDLVIDGIVYTRGTYGLSRAELCANNGVAAGSPNCPGIGFRITWNTASGTPTLPNGPHQLQVRVQDESGRFTLIPSQPLTIVVQNAQQTAPRAVLTTPSNLERVRGVIRVTGHAWDPDGRVTSVTLLVNGVNRGAARYGIASPQACASLPDVPACPNIGFEVEFDTRLLPNGLHRLGVLVRDDQGNTATLPNTTNAGINIYVEN